MSRHGVGVRDVLGREVKDGDVVVVHDGNCSQCAVAPKLLFDNMLYGMGSLGGGVTDGGVTDLNRTQYTLYGYRADDVDQATREKLLTMAQRNMTMPVDHAEPGLAMRGKVGHAMLRRNGLVNVYLGKGRAVTMPEDGKLRAFTGHCYLQLRLGQVLDLRRMLANGSTPLALKGDELLLTCSDAGELVYDTKAYPGELVTKRKPEQAYIADLGKVPGLDGTVTLPVRGNVYPVTVESAVFYRDDAE